MLLNFLLAPFERRACFSPQIEVKRPLDVNPEADEIRVLMFGDCGSGGPEQKNIGEKSALTCEKLGCDLVLMLGDNFIQYGVESIHDPQFREKFEEIYPQNLPFYAILGNHDLKGNWRAQVEYTNHSERWNMPNVNYRFIGGPVQFMGINTSCTICSLWNLLTPRPTPWRLVFGHRPMETQGRHRGMTWLEKVFIRSTSAQLYCCGHNHLLEHYRFRGLDQITAGGGGSPLENDEVRSSGAAEFLHLNYGYVWVHFTRETLDAHFFDQDGLEIYQFARNQSEP